VLTHLLQLMMSLFPSKPWLIPSQH